MSAAGDGDGGSTAAEIQRTAGEGADGTSPRQWRKLTMERGRK